MEIVASGARDHVHRASVGNTGRKIEIRGRDLKLLHHFLREAHLRAERAHRHDAAAIDRDPRSAASRLRYCLRALPDTGTNVRLLLLRDGGCTPGSSLASSRKLRPFSGRPSICACVTTPPTVCGIVLHLRCGGIYCDGVLHVADASTLKSAVVVCAGFDRGLVERCAGTPKPRRSPHIRPPEGRENCSRLSGSGDRSRQPGRQCSGSSHVLRPRRRRKNREPHQQWSRLALGRLRLRST